jgi:hypothetical protein
MDASDLNNLERFTETVVEMCEQAKTALCVAHGGPVDAPPILLWLGETDLEIVALPMPSNDDPELIAPRILTMALQEGFVQFGVPKCVAFVSEAFMKLASSQKEVDNFERGDLQRKFQDSIDFSVTEIISVYAFSPSKTLHKVITVKYNDDGMPEFGRFEEDEEEVTSGAIADVVSQFRVLLNVG